MGTGVAELPTFRSHRKFTAGPGVAEMQTFENHENLQWDLASLSYKSVKVIGIFNGIWRR